MPVTIAPQNIQAIITGDGDNRGQIKYIKDGFSDEITQESIIYTSGTGAIFKSGIPIGRLSILQYNLTSKYACLCYHYIRTPESIEKFPRIMGLSVSQFENHIKFLKNDFSLYSLHDINSIHSEKKKLNSKIGLHITFDDGLSDHFLAAKILEENNISATFFIPSCIISDKTPANPMIIHYVIARFKTINSVF